MVIGSVRGFADGQTGRMDTADSTRRALGSFLRGVRETRDPAAFGHVPTGRRRTPGLRREEVAAASGVGLAWYTWLEQGRVSTSRQVLESIARALRMDADERRHVLTLGGVAVEAGPSQGAVEDMRELLDHWPLTPAALVDHRFDILAANLAFTAVWSEPIDPETKGNLLLAWATHADQRVALVTEEPIYELYLRFRVNADRFAQDTRFTRILEVLQRVRPDRAHWWRCRGVRESGTWPLALREDDGRTLRWTCSLLRPTAATVSVLVQAPADGDTSEWIEGQLAPGEFTGSG